MDLGQFGLNRLALQKQIYGALPLKRLCIAEQFNQRRASPCRHNIEPLGSRIFDPGIANFDSNAGPLTHGLKKLTLFSSGFEKHSSETRPITKQNCEHQAGKAGTTTEVHQADGLSWNESDQLCRVPQVTTPNITK